MTGKVTGNPALQERGQERKVCRVKYGVAIPWNSLQFSCEQQGQFDNSGIDNNNY